MIFNENNWKGGALMPFEAIAEVSLAEERANKLVSEAEVEAKRIAAEAETYGKACMENAAAKAGGNDDGNRGKGCRGNRKNQ